MPKVTKNANNHKIQSWRQGECSRSYKLFIAYIFIQCWLLLEGEVAWVFFSCVGPLRITWPIKTPIKVPYAGLEKLGSDGSDGALDGITWECILRSSVALSSTRSRGSMSSEAGLNCILSSPATFRWSSEVTSESESRIMRGVLRSSAGWPGELVAPNWVAQPCFLWGQNLAIWTDWLTSGTYQCTMG